VRDLKNDLEVCNAATKNWELDEFIEPAYFGDTLIAVEHLYDGYEKDAAFIINAREGWHEAINRAIAAEAEVERLKLEVAKLALHHTEDIELMEETVEAQKLALATITKLRKALALAHSMILGGEQYTEQSRQVIEGALGLL